MSNITADHATACQCPADPNDQQPWIEPLEVCGDFTDDDEGFCLVCGHVKDCHANP